MGTLSLKESEGVPEFLRYFESDALCIPMYTIMERGEVDHKVAPSDRGGDDRDHEVNDSKCGMGTMPGPNEIIRTRRIIKLNCLTRRGMVQTKRSGKR